ncbi:serine/threonine-protein kinase [Brachybacterium paraconglomeratum]|uniref:serine/threonine-protein kinase n=1 Tax=Brachybacterium paraconglomeratum TaxID=173362 RepID=UPI003FD3E90E
MTARGERYRLGGVIGAGSFATVHRARDERLDADVAVKVLAENHSLNPEIRERFIAEGRSLRRVGGRHLVSVHDIDQNERQQPYLVLELADRGSLRRRVEELRAGGWRATAADVLAVARPLAAAVAAVHRAQLVHRDLSPGNLLLTSTSGEAARAVGIESSPSAVVRADERLLVADLGMCKDLARSSGLTVAAGTDGFRPPEQSRPGTVDIRADIWAMSALLRWLIDDTDMPQALQDVLARGLSEDPAARQAEATEWLAEVEEALSPPPPELPASGTAPEAVGGSAENGPAGAADGSPGADGDSEARSSGADGTTTHTTASQATHAPTGSGAEAPTSSPRRRALLVALPVLALGVGLGAGSLLGLDASAPSAAGDSSLAIAGPDEIRVGEQAVFTAEVQGVDSWVCTLPTGEHLVDEQQATLTASGPGRAELVLRARTPEGQELEARRVVRVHA